ncbi:MAG: DUF5053 domain-containing protein [Candidatus Azobacteroides sp.]|nr:DUF5053 domain-containing protein [Candidatus Azobacteroides sp.]
MNDIEKLKVDFDHVLQAGQNMTKEEFEAYVDNYLSTKTKEENEMIGTLTVSAIESNLSKLEDIDNEITMLTQLEGINEFVKLSKLSKAYFGKSKAWIYQRLNEHKVHGKPSKFTDDEKAKLSSALLDLSEKIRSVALKIT